MVVVLCFEYNDPADQQTVPNNSSCIHPNMDEFPFPLNTSPICSLNNKITPPKPTTSPIMVALLLRLTDQLLLSNTTIQMGAEETNMATMPLGNVRSASKTTPMATNNSKKPVTAADIISFHTHIFSF